MNVPFFNQNLQIGWFKNETKKDFKARIAGFFFQVSDRAIEDIISEVSKEATAVIDGTEKFLFESGLTDSLESFEKDFMSTSDVASEVRDVQILFNKHFTKMKREFYKDPQVIEAFGLEPESED